MQRAAVTNSIFFTDSTGPRATRAKMGVYTMAMAMMVLFSPRPNAVMTNSASKMAGKAKKMSIVRIIMLSTRPPAYADMVPISVPARLERATEANATYSELLAPRIRRLRMSRPKRSVPRR